MEYKEIVKRKSDDELQHHKYVKRVKGSNGKYRYYYDVKDALGVDERKARKQAESSMYDTYHRPGATQQEKDQSFGEYAKATDNYFKTPLGKLERASEYVNSGARYISWLMKGKNN